MKAPPFAYARATSLPDALQLLATHADAKAIAGGQSLLAALAFRLSQPSLLVDIGRLDALRGIEISGDRVRIGALTTHAELARNDVIRRRAPLLARAAKLIAHPAIRNRGTIGGSLAYADPAAELPACCVALDAEIVAVSSAGERRFKAVDFFTGLLTTALAANELIVAVELPASRPEERQAIVEVARRSGDYAMAGAVANIVFDGGFVRDARLVLFGVGDGPVLVIEPAAVLNGQPLNAASISKAQAALTLDPPPDQHGGAAMKRHLARVVLGRALQHLTTVKAA